MQLKQGTSLQGNKNLYRIEGVLGQGGFGITYLATMSVQVEGSLGKINTKVKVAIKEFFMKDLCNRSESTSHVSVPSEGSKDLVERYKQKFIKEAKSISRLQHPHIIKMVEVFEGNGTAYYVMEYIEGSSLQELARQRGALPEQEALRYIVQIASALDYIHSRQLNHLNVKPGNIICQPDGEVVLIDFGLSKQYDERGEETSSTPLGISAGYSPIEQYEGVSQFSAPTDIYALGATLYKLITGQNPPVASDVMNAGLPPLPAGISADTVQAIQKAMEPGRRNRLQTIKEFLALLPDVEETKRIPTSGSAPRPIPPIPPKPKPWEPIPTSGSAPRPIPPIPPKPKPKQFPWKPIVAIVSIAAAAFLLFFLLGANSSGIKGPEAAIEMVYVQGGTFSMGCSGEQGGDCHGNEKPLHSVTVSSFNIGKYEVTQAQWKQIMGSNPSVFKGDNLPVENVSWEDVQEFISKLNAATGKRYRLPTEAEWEYAARGGNRSQGYKYSGSNNLNNVAWYWDNSSNKTHPVGAKSPNELGVYDMSGNVWEWCSDRYGDYNSSSQTNPTGPSTGSYRVLRGGSWSSYAENCHVSNRFGDAPGRHDLSIGFRLVLPPPVEQATPSPAIEMVYVQGGTFSMGCEQGSDYCDSDEKPLHSVTVSNFNIGKYEVTQAQWKQIMGSNPSYFKDDNLPVENVSWEDVQEFISKLNAATGKRYRLPTEAEWEYAARGGNRSQGYKYSGSNNLNNVAWYKDNSSSKTHPVGAKSPNELGVYDMSGNVWEWCSDWYGNYNSSSQTNPTGPSTGSYRVLRGGSWYNYAWSCHVSIRYDFAPGYRDDGIGFRLGANSSGIKGPEAAVDSVTITEIQKPVDNPSRQIQDSRQSAKTKSAPVEQTKPAPVEQATPSPAIEMVYVQGGTFSMGCSGEQGSDCYYDEKPLHSVTVSNFNIGKYEVTQAQWKQIMGSNPSYFKDDNLPVESVSWADVQEFISKLNAATGKRYRLPTEAEWEYAARGGNRSQGYKYSGSNNLNNVAWYWDNSSSKTHPVGAKSPNELGVYDMIGNVWEWCSDWYGNYNSSSQTNPTGSSNGSSRVLRGGSWGNDAEICHVSVRSDGAPGSRNDVIGFRLGANSSGIKGPEAAVDSVTITEIQKPVDNPSRQIQDSRQSAKTKSAPVEQTKPAPVEQATPSPAIEMVYVQGGTFSMGCSGEQGSDCDDDEKPLHSVTVRNFNIGKYEVTQAQWKQIMGSNPSYFKDDNLPVERVSWEDVQEFISKLNAATGKRYRLPTEAEWEYAARGGNRSQGYKYSGSNNLNNVAWYWDNSSNKTHPVGAKSPNELGVYDMSGNVYEWCSDWYGNYNSSSQTNPTGPSTGSSRVLRGGGWYGNAKDCHVSNRDYGAPGGRNDLIGFRLVLPL